MKICLECEGITSAEQARCASCGVGLTDSDVVHFPIRRGEAEAANPLLGTTIDETYQIQGVLGRGGMGTVYRAVHQVSLVPVALKILNPRHAASAEYREFFLAEAQKAGRVIHEHTSRILDVGETEDGVVYIAMEEVRGVTLYECMHGDRPLPPSVVVDILSQICDALVAAHQAGLVHRDLSPRNVMVVERSGRPFVKILDFGIAKGLPQVAGIPGAAVPAGYASPPYSAPEHLSGAAVDPRGDLYSLGVLAYEALTQRLPVRGTNPRELAEATMRGEVIPLGSVRGVPPRLQALVGRLLSVDPAGRPESAETVRNELRELAQPTSRWLRDTALLVCLVATVVCWFAFANPGRPVLTSDARTPFYLGDQLDRRGEERSLRLEQLAHIELRYEDLDVSALRAEVVHGDVILFRSRLGATARGGWAVLDRGASPRYAEFLQRLASACREYGAVQVSFVLGDGQVLGSCRLLLDDIAPRLTLACEPDRGGLIRGDTQLRIDCDDQGTLEEFELICLVDGQVVLRRDLHEEDFLARLPGRRVNASDWLASLQRSAAPVANVELRLVATDAAGNRAEPKSLRLTLDLRVPELKTSDLIAVLGVDRARSKFELAGGETEAVTVMLREPAPQPRWQRVSVVQTGSVVEFELPKPPVGVSARKIEIRLMDQAGNLRDVIGRVTYFEEKVQLRLLPAAKLAQKLLPRSGELVWSGDPVVFEFGCGPLYRPAAVSVVGRSGSVWARLLDGATFGRGRIEFSAVREDSDSELQVRLEPKTGSATVLASWPVRVRAKPMTLHLPDAEGARFLRQVTDDVGLFQVAGDKSLVQPPAWLLQPSHPRLLTGEVLSRGQATDPWIRQRIENPGSGGFLPPIAPRRGRNEVWLRLADVFGRPVAVRMGGRALQPSPAMDGAVPIATFEAQQAVGVAPAEPLRLEFGQPTRVQLLSDYRFTDADKGSIRLEFQGRDYPCIKVERTGERTVMRFEIGFRQMAVAADKTDSELLRPGHRFKISATLRSPAGDQAFVQSERLQVETTRSSLIQVRAGERNEALPPELAEIVMIPVLAPYGAFADRVTEDLRRRGGLLRRREIAVRGIEDGYLQQRELTFAQFEALRQALIHWKGPPENAKALVFPGDPLGIKRLQGAALLPLGVPLAQWPATVRRRAAEPVVGLDFYQAFAIARIAGQVLFGDAEALRLPFGVEMEVAALGQAQPGQLLGAVGQRPAGTLTVETARGRIAGLDFGVREWVMDLPWPVAGSEEQRETMAGWLADHPRHVMFALRRVRMPGSLHDLLGATGVVRGIPVADAVDIITGARARAQPALPPTVAGVVQTALVPRNGQGLVLGRPHFLLSQVGLRFAGGSRFVKMVRPR